MTIIKLGDLVEVLESNDPAIQGEYLVLDKIDEDNLGRACGPFFVDKVPDRHDDDEGGYETTFTNYGWAVRIRLVQEEATSRTRYSHDERLNRVEVDGDGKFVRAWKSSDEPAAQDAVAVEEEDDEAPAPALLPVGAHVVIKRAIWAEERHGHTGVIERNDDPHKFTGVDGVTVAHPYRIKVDGGGPNVWAAEVELVDTAPESNDPEDGQPVKTLGDFIRAMLSGGVDVEPPQIVSMGIITPDGRMQEMTPEELAARGVFVHGPDCGCEDPGALPDGELDLGQKLAALANEAEASRHDPVNHPSHYTSMPTGVECIDVIEWMNLCRGNAIKYIWRAGQKDPSKEIEDLEKAVWYLNREIDRLRRVQR